LLLSGDGISAFATRVIHVASAVRLRRGNIPLDLRRSLGTIASGSGNAKQYQGSDEYLIHDQTSIICRETVAAKIG
jgi:hypothetical protein